MKHSLLLTLAACGLFASCSQYLRSESGLYDVKLNHTYKAAVDGAWTLGKGNPFAHQKSGSIYVSPLWVKKEIEEEEPELSKELVKHMHGYIADHMGRMLAESNKANKTNWTLASSPEGADIRIDLAVVNLTPRRPGLNMFSQVGSVFSPIPGLGTVAGKLTKGDIRIEGTIRNAHTNELLMAFKDSNRKTVHLLNKDAYSYYGHAEANLNEWARRLAKLCRNCSYDRIGTGTIKEKVQNRSVGDAIKVHVMD